MTSSKIVIRAKVEDGSVRVIRLDFLPNKTISFD